MIGGIHPIIGRIGGKSKLKKRIVSMFPDNYENMTYVEPFVGGGSIFFYKNESKKEIINDLDKNVISIYKGFKKYSPEIIFNELKKIKRTREIYYYFRDNYKPKTEFNKFIRLYYLYKNAFFADITAGFTKPKNEFTNKNITEYEERLKHTIILNKNYADVIRKYDSTNTFFYLDPPYENSDKLYEHFSLPISDVYNVLKNIKGRFLLSYNNSTEAKELFKNYKIKYLKTKYSDPIKGGAVRIKTEMVISNY
jgi:DNA adenine methylase